MQNCTLLEITGEGRLKKGSSTSNATTRVTLRCLTFYIIREKKKGRKKRGGEQRITVDYDKLWYEIKTEGHMERAINLDSYSIFLKHQWSTRYQHLCL